MKIEFYVTPNFIRNGYSHSKIMFYVENIGYFGVFINGKSGNIEKQAYEIIKMKTSNIIGDRNAGIYTKFSVVKNYWNRFSELSRERIFKASKKAHEAFKYFIKKYENQIKSYNAGDVTPDEMLHILDEYVCYFIGFIDCLKNGYSFDIDQKI